MTRHDKVLDRMRRNPCDWRVQDLQAIADRLGIDWVHEGSSHVVFRSPDHGHLSVPAHRPVKPVYIKKFLALVDKHGDE
jgi:hypothetical protein